jgi:hypothetical protein
VTCSWLVFRRILYGPLWWLVWLPLKLLWKFSITTLGILGVFTSGEVKNLTDIQINQTESIMSAGINREQHIPIEEPANQDPNYGTHATSAEGSEIEKVGKIAEQGGEKEERYRGDGTKLVDSDTPRNPKKRVLNEEPTNMNNQDAASEGKETKDKDEL